MDIPAKPTHSIPTLTIDSPIILFLLIFLLGLGSVFIWSLQNKPTQLPVSAPPSALIRIPTVTPEENLGWKIYKNLDLGYSFEYPASWSMKGPTTEGPIVYFWSNESPDSNPESLNYFIYTDILANKNKLSFKNLILSKISDQNLKNHFEYTKEKIGQYDVYKTESLPSQRGELGAFIGKDDSTYISITLDPFSSTQPYELQDKYLNLFDQVLSTFKFINQPLTDDSTNPSSYIDKNILSVTTDANKIIYSKFPEGLFSRNTDEWGLINYTNDPVKLTINFVRPVSISSIEVIFTNCPDKNYPNGYTGQTGCYYTVAADGFSNNNQIYKIIYQNSIYPTKTVDGVGPDVLDKTYYNDTNLQLTRLTFTIKRLGNDLDDFVHLKKIYITYFK